MIIRGQQASLIHLILNLRARAGQLYPLFLREFCVFAVLSEVRGPGTIRLKTVHADSSADVFSTRPRLVAFGTDPLEAYGVPFRLRNCLFPMAGLYWIQFCFDEDMLFQQELFLR